MNCLVSTSFRALGTTAVVAVTEPDALEPARDLLERELAEVDLACSRFRSDSELCRVQAGAGTEVPVSDVLIEALDVALRAARLTSGLVTPAIGGPLVLSGYDADFSALRPSLRPPRLVAAPDWRLITLDPERRTVCVPAGMQLDLGSTAKAFAADRAAASIVRETGAGALVSLGGDISVAGPPPPAGWPIVVDDAHDVITERGSRISISTGGLATSSTTTRRWRRASAELHHILDPRTGAPANGPWRTVSVAAASCVDANIASTAAVILGERAPDWLRERQLPARLVALSDAVVTVCGWPQEDAA